MRPPTGCATSHISYRSSGRSDAISTTTLPLPSPTKIGQTCAEASHQLRTVSSTNSPPGQAGMVLPIIESCKASQPRENHDFDFTTCASVDDCLNVADA